MKTLIILGTAGNSIDILDTINDINDFQKQSVYQCVGFLDDNNAHWGKEVHGVKVLGPLHSATQYGDCYFVNGIGSPFNFWRKEEIIAKTNLSVNRFETIIHPTASVSKMSRLGFGTVIFQNVTITSNVKIGNHIIVLPNTVISHDDIIDDYTCIAGGVCISGEVQIGKLCYLGTNCSIKHNINIGNNVLVGMGSVVLSNIPENTVVVGSPARFLRKLRSDE